MPFKVDIKTDFDESKLDITQLKEVIASLKVAYKNTRNEIYSYFLGKRSFRLAISLAVIFLILYLASTSMFFIYAALLSFILVMAVSLVLAETTSKMIRRAVKSRISILEKRLEALKRKEEFN